MNPPSKVQAATWWSPGTAQRQAVTVGCPISQGPCCLAAGSRCLRHGRAGHARSELKLPRLAARVCTWPAQRPAAAAGAIGAVQYSTPCPRSTCESVVSHHIWLPQTLLGPLPLPLDAVGVGEPAGSVPVACRAKGWGCEVRFFWGGFKAAHESIDAPQPCPRFQGPAAPLLAQGSRAGAP